MLAALLGVDVARIAQHERSRHDTHVAWLALTAVVFALATTAVGALGAVAQQRSVALEAQRQAAGRNAMQATQLRWEAIAAGQAQLAEQAQANADLQSAKATLSEAVRNVGTLAELVLNEMSTNRSASAANIEALGAIERSYSKLGDVAPYFEFRPASIAPILERLSSAYTQIGRAEDGRRATSRLMRLNNRIAQSHSANPAWRNAYAAGIAALADQRATSGDNAGQVNALQQAAQIYEDVCLVAPRPSAALDHPSPTPGRVLAFATPTSLWRGQVCKARHNKISIWPLWSARAWLSRPPSPPTQATPRFNRKAPVFAIRWSVLWLDLKESVRHRGQRLKPTGDPNS